MPLLALMFSLALPALSDDAVPPTAASPTAAPPTTEPAPAEPAPSHVAVTAGPVVVLPSLTTIPAAGLSFAGCTTVPEPSGAGTLVFEVRVRRGRVSLVSVMSADAGVLAWQPCLERVLADYAWPLRSGSVRVPVVVAEP